MNKKLTLALLFASMLCFGSGLTYPILATKHQVLGFTLKYQELSLLDSIQIFYDGEEFLLAGLIFTFTIIFPALKYLELLIRISYNLRSTFLSKLDKWSMLDVFLVALLVLNFKLDSTIIVMRLEIGTHWIAISVLLRMLTASLIRVKTKPKLWRTY